MFNVGGGEIVVILLVALVVLGPTKLPAVARQMGSFLTEIRRISDQFKRELNDSMPDEVHEFRRDLDDTRRSLRSMSIDERIEAQARERGRAMLAGDSAFQDTPNGKSTAEAAGMFDTEMAQAEPSDAAEEIDGLVPDDDSEPDGSGETQ